MESRRESTVIVRDLCCAGNCSGRRAAVNDDTSSVSAGEREVRELEKQFERAVVKGDVEFFQRVLPPEFTHTTQTGKLRDRDEWLANHKAGQSNYDALNVDQISVHVFGSTAVVTARITPQGRDSQGKPIEGHTAICGSGPSAAAPGKSWRSKALASQTPKKELSLERNELRSSAWRLWPCLGRRRFLRLMAGAVAAVPIAARAIEPFPRKRPSHLKLSLAAYCYRPYLSGDKPSMDLFDFVNLAADLGVDAVELTSYYFPDNVDNDYLHRLSQHAFLQGLDVSGTAVMNDFCLPDGSETQAQLKHVHSWIDYAAELDWPEVRILSGNWIQGTPDEELERRVIGRINQLFAARPAAWRYARAENHGGGVTTTPENLLRIVKAVQGTNFGVNLDTGNFHGPDPYAEIAATAPYAVNVQVKTEIRRQGKYKEPADLAKTIHIVRAWRYSGYVVLEYNAADDPEQVFQVRERTAKSHKLIVDLQFSPIMELCRCERDLT